MNNPIDEFEEAIGLKGAIYVVEQSGKPGQYFAGNAESVKILVECGLSTRQNYDYDWLLKYVSAKGYCLETDSEE
jgi:hypothetical protein